jgi:phage terminase Nu1 subunit (DNA packaging protein)
MSGRPESVPTPERYVAATELAELMGVSVRTIDRFRAAGMPSEDWGMKRTRRYLPSQAMAWAHARVAPNRARDATHPDNREPKE